jgi:hypothetical protein
MYRLEQKIRRPFGKSREGCRREPASFQLSRHDQGFLNKISVTIDQSFAIEVAGGRVANVR